MDGIPLGRFETGNVIVYSGDYGRQKYANVPGIPDSQAQEAEAKVKELAGAIGAELPNIDEAYVYVGAAAMDGAMRLIRDLRKAGKQVTMIFCDCCASAKLKMAAELQVPHIKCECGGRITCAQLVRQLAAGDPANN